MDLLFLVASLCVEVSLSDSRAFRPAGILAEISRKLIRAYDEICNG